MLALHRSCAVLCFLATLCVRQLHGNRGLRSERLKPKLLPGGVPKVLHQSYKTREIPEGAELYRGTWKEYHPEWQYKFWTDEDNLELVERHYPWFLATYNALPLNIMRADVSRFFYMHRYGGVYADLDFDFLKPLDGLLRDEAGPIFARMGDDNSFTHSIPNAWMASTPGHPFWIYAATQVMVQLVAGDPYWVSRPEHLTGPVLLYYAIQSWYHTQVAIEQDRPQKPLQKISILGPSTIFPVNWANFRNECSPRRQEWDRKRCIEGYPDAYGITYWAHMWEERGQKQ